MPADVHGRVSRCGQDARALIRAMNPAALSATQYQGAMDAAVTAFAEGDPNYSADAARKYPTYDPERARQLARRLVAIPGLVSAVVWSFRIPTAGQISPEKATVTSG